jgi:hypothetical protein
MDADTSEDNIRLWTREEYREFILNPPAIRYKHCIGCVDSIFIQIPRPDSHDISSEYYCYYKRMYCIFFTVICDREGRIRYIDDGVPPRKNSDIGALAISHLHLPSPLKLLADGHYRTDSRCEAPFNATDLARHPDKVSLMRFINKNLRSQRILIEWIFQRLRGHFGIIENKFPYEHHVLSKTMNVICLLYNYMCRTKFGFPGLNMADMSGIEVEAADHIEEVPEVLPEHY